MEKEMEAVIYLFIFYVLNSWAKINTQYFSLMSNIFKFWPLANKLNLL